MKITILRSFVIILHLIILLLLSGCSSADKADANAPAQQWRNLNNITDITSGEWHALSSVAWSGSEFVAVGSDIIITSPDGITWTLRTSSEIGKGLDDITWSGNQFVAVGNFGKIITSPDGITWTPRTSWTSRTPTEFRAVTSLYDDTIIVRGGPNLWSVTYSGTQYIAVGDNGIILTSADGIRWVLCISGVNKNLFSVTWSGTQFVAVGRDGTIITSPDGITWTPQTSGIEKGLHAITWSGTQFVAVGEDGIIITSPDGITWTPQTSGMVDGLRTMIQAVSIRVPSKEEILAEKVYLSDIAWDGTKFVAVGSLGIILTSSDGIKWTLRSAKITPSLLGIAWSGKQFVAVGDNTNIMVSP